MTCFSETLLPANSLIGFFPASGLQNVTNMHIKQRAEWADIENPQNLKQKKEKKSFDCTQKNKTPHF